MTHSHRITRALTVALKLALTLGALGCAQPAVDVRAPARIAQSLAFIEDLAAAATLVREGTGPEATVELSRGEDGVTFSAFIDATPGTYVLEIVFSGVPATGDAALDDGRRRFLGRLTSDSFTVADGTSTTPTFSSAVDTIGREGDRGDEDEDGLGFLDELLVGSDPALADTDGDGVNDGSDCLPNDNDSAYVISAEGSFEDCDGDGFRSLVAPFGPRGDDCDDEAPETNPLAVDDCTTNADEDCNAQTCPIADGLGPEIEVLTPLAGAPIGCTAPFVIEAVDPSQVLSAHMIAPDDDLPGEADRFVQLLDDGDGVTFRAKRGFGETGLLADGPLRVELSAIDTAANLATVPLDVVLLSSFPEITLSGPASILDAPVDITVAVNHTRDIVSLDVRAAPVDALTGAVAVDDEIVLEQLPVGGGTVTVDPEALPGAFVVYAVAIDDIGNAAAPARVPAFDPVSGIEASFACDGVAHTVPAIARRRDITGPVTALTFLAEATAIARALDATVYLTQISADGFDANGFIDLSRTDASIGISYRFMTPEQVAVSADPEGPSVTWFSAFDGVENPVVNPTGAFQVDEITNPAALPDSDVVVPMFAQECQGNPPAGFDGDVISYLNDGDGSLFPVGTNYVAVDTEQGHSWTQNATNLSDPLGFCCDPDCS